MDLVTVAAYRYPHEGQFARALLADADIPVVLVGEFNELHLGNDGVRIRVPAPLADEARAVLRAAGEDGAVRD